MNPPPPSCSLLRDVEKYHVVFFGEHRGIYDQHFQAILSLNDGGFLQSFPTLDEAQTAWLTIYPDQPTPPAISQARETTVNELTFICKLACNNNKLPPAPLFKPAFPTKSVSPFKPAPPRTPSPSKTTPSTKRPVKPSRGELLKLALVTPLHILDPMLGIASLQFRQFIKMTAKSTGPSNLLYEDTLNVEDEYDGEVVYWVVLQGKKLGIYEGQATWIANLASGGTWPTLTEVEADHLFVCAYMKNNVYTA
ncbi:hypothetical protein ARMSODRAFT_1012851 [Armillaria solidipes]|uniref:Uncharacterized protein n=1 Tax=Armillaria solidipes TaxID=1076256 RepID=A0A2H3CGX0_9AGAR|nr:hypothetical protein ARMSODRAFT_1012851 [Armillaria solidipes]